MPHHLKKPCKENICASFQINLRKIINRRGGHLEKKKLREVLSLSYIFRSLSTFYGRIENKYSLKTWFVFLYNISCFNIVFVVPSKITRDTITKCYYFSCEEQSCLSCLSKILIRSDICKAFSHVNEAGV